MLSFCLVGSFTFTWRKGMYQIFYCRFMIIDPSFLPKILVRSENSLNCMCYGLAYFIHPTLYQPFGSSPEFTPSSSTMSVLNISLEPHLRDALNPLQSIFSDLKPYLDPHTITIPYSFLLSISKWSRTASLKILNLDANAYTMISLLAGTTTSPERKFPTYFPPDPH